MYVSLRFILWLKWIDTRLGYENLAEKYYRNKISDDKAAKLWKPLVVFKNNVEGQNLQFEPSTSDIFLNRTGGSTEAPLEQAYEAEVYASNETEIIWRSTHLMKFKCQFDLYYLPFDNQTCFVEVS